MQIHYLRHPRGFPTRQGSVSADAKRERLSIMGTHLVMELTPPLSELAGAGAGDCSPTEQTTSRLLGPLIEGLARKSSAAATTAATYFSCMSQRGRSSASSITYKHAASKRKK